MKMEKDEESQETDNLASKLLKSRTVVISQQVDVIYKNIKLGDKELAKKNPIYAKNYYMKAKAIIGEEEKDEDMNKTKTRDDIEKRLARAEYLITSHQVSMIYKYIK